MTRDQMLAHARRLVADWPPLTPQQRTALGALIRPAATVHLGPPTRREAVHHAA